MAGYKNHIAGLLLLLSASGALASKDYGKLPIQFEANRGQSPDAVRFQARGSGFVFQLQDAAKASITLRDAESGLVEQLRTSFPGANPTVKAEAIDLQSGYSNYLIGAEPKNWITKVPHYNKVLYKSVYSGIDVVFYGNQRTFEYDFVVAPGANPEQIRIRTEGAKRTYLDRSGDLVFELASGIVRQHRPVAYQMIGDRRRPISAEYVLGKDHEVALHLGNYNRKQPLVIDPVIAYWAYIGGSNTETGEGIALDSQGNAYIAGQILSATGLQTVTPFQPAFGGGAIDAFVTKINAAGTAIVYSTYLGGTGNDAAYDIAVNPAGQAYIVGETFSTNFPVLGALAGAQGGGDAFVTALNAAGTGLVFSTYLAGSAFDIARGVALDPSGNVVVCGITGSSNLTGIGSSTGGGGTDAFLIKLAANGSNIIFGTYVGGSGGDAAYAVASDRNGNSYVTGETTSTNIAAQPGAFQTANAGALDAFVAKYNSSGARQYWAYLGGTGADKGNGIAVDALGNAYVGGDTSSTNFPLANPFQAANGGAGDAFVAKLNFYGSGLIYSTYLGGNTDDSASSVALLGAALHVAGRTASTDFPITPDSPKTADASYDVFATRFSAAGNTLVYSNRIGGTFSDQALGIAVDLDGSVYLTGFTRSAGLPTTLPGSALNGTQDAFIAKLTLPPTLTLERTELRYGATANLVTSAQSVRLTTSRTTAWTAVSSQPYIVVSPASGTGTTTIQISVNRAIAGALSDGTVTVTAPGAGGSPQTIQVRITNIATSQIPFGTVDTPAPAATVSGAVAFTGWALDDVEVRRVTIWRNTVAGETTAQPNGLVFIGDGIFLAGARPDVAAAFPTLPLNYRGGWGVLVLTNVLPNSAGSGPAGNGTYTFSLFADDLEGNRVLLGTRTLTINNAASVRPFGTIDTPESAQDISGAFNNFGWAMSSCLIPLNGSTIIVFVDSQPVGNPSYGGFRSDLATLFPTFPNATTANGVFGLNTTALTDGIHSIAWSVSDSCGNLEGIGSRNFYVTNGNLASPSQEINESTVRAKGTKSARRSEPVLSRQGWDLGRSAEPLIARGDGSYEVRLGQNDRIELELGLQVTAAYLQVGETREALPIGSSFDPELGRFAWIPLVGYYGTYDLVFVDAQGGATTVRVSVGAE